MSFGTTAAKDQRLSRRLGFWSSIGFVIGMTIGSGIFRTPAQIAARVPDPLWMLAVWALGGAVTLCGALSIAELAASLPQAGGLYVFLREGWGRGTAFVFTWSELVLIRAAGLSGIATVFGEYFLRSFGYDPVLHPAAADYCAVGSIIVATIANVRGVQTGALMTGMTSAAKFAALAFVAVAALVLGRHAEASAAHFATGQAPVRAGLFGLAFISVLWAYDGFLDVAFLAGEVEPSCNELDVVVPLEMSSPVGIQGKTVACESVARRTPRHPGIVVARVRRRLVSSSVVVVSVPCERTSPANSGRCG